MIKPHSLHKLIVLGGGTSGLVSAMIIARANPHITVEVLESSELGIIGVGEGSTEHWSEFMAGVGLDLDEMLRETDATFKTGIKFVNWNGDGTHYFHSVVSPYNSEFINRVPSFYTYCIANGIEQERMMADNIAWSKFVPNHMGTNQFHFDTFKLNQWLHKKARQFGIKFTDTLIEDVLLDDQGYVTALVDKDGKKHEADFFIDSSGFKRIIISKLGAKWMPVDDHLPMNGAIAFPTGYLEDIPAYTTSTAMSSGWIWNIPTQQRQGNGYVFCDQFITPEQAKLEAEAHLGQEVEVAKTFKFTAGHVDRPMIKNCVAVGLSAIFVEPLEASSIGCSLQQSFVLNNLLANYFVGNSGMEKQYNRILSSVFSNIVDFIQLHYFTKRDDSEFWRWAKNNIVLTDFNKETLDMFKHTMPSLNQFDTPFHMFRNSNWTLVLAGLDMFNKESITKCWLNQPEYARKEIDAYYTKYKFEDSKIAIMTHREQIAEWSKMKSKVFGDNR